MSDNDDDHFQISLSFQNGILDISSPFPSLDETALFLEVALIEIRGKIDNPLCKIQSDSVH